MNQKSHRLYKNRQGKFYMKFDGKKIYIKGLSKDDILKFYNKLLRTKKKKRGNKRRKQAPKQRMTQQEVTPPSRVQPWTSSGPATNPHVHEDEVKRQIIENRIKEIEAARPALEQRLRQIEYAQPQLLGYEPEIDELGTDIARLSDYAREGARRLAALEYNSIHQASPHVSRQASPHGIPQAESEEETNERNNSCAGHFVESSVSPESTVTSLYPSDISK